MFFLGIDPGADGAIALVNNVGEYQDCVCARKVTPTDMYLFLKKYQGDIPYGVLEKVSSSPQQGVKSAFSFGVSFGFVRGLLVCNAVSYEEASPVKWMKAMNCMTGGNKNVTKAAAQRLWPTCKITHANADALLIAEYARRTYYARMGQNGQE